MSSIVCVLVLGRTDVHSLSLFARGVKVVSPFSLRIPAVLEKQQDVSLILALHWG